MNTLEIDGVPCPSANGEAVGAARKVRMLQAAGEDHEWYPTTPEIMTAMERDIWTYLRRHKNDYRGNKEKVRLTYKSKWNDGEEVEKKEGLVIDSFLDIGAGDGRVLDHFDASRKYGIEIARTQADDLIRRGVFIIGRNYWDCSLIDQQYGLVFSNPPYSCFEMWVAKILYECNFELLYLVMPVRWKNRKEITKELKRYETTVIGEYDFSEGERAARGRVNLVRVNAPWIKEKSNGKNYKFQQSIEDAFDRWVRENIAKFKEEAELEREEDRETALALMKTPIDRLIDDYETEKENLGAAFRAIGKLPPEIIKIMGQDKSSMLEIIRKSIKGLKSKYWRAAFDKLDPVQERMTKKTRDKIFNKIKEFKTMDFNADNIYSIIIWIINNANIGILEQIGEVFDTMTKKEYVEAYKSNRHWVKSDWRHTYPEWKYNGLPERWKIGLDYRIVVDAAHYKYDDWSIVDDFIVICRNLGFPIKKCCVPDYNDHGVKQEFLTVDDNTIAFTMRYYTGNHNAHLKINEQLLMKFNVEVAKIRKWMTEPDDVAEEFGVSKEEASRIWNGGLALLGAGDVKMLEFKEG
jgi:hypothetical protein